MLTLLGLGWLVAAAMMHLLWLLQKRTRNAGIVDVGWTLGLGILPVLYALLSEGLPERRALVATLAALWSFRLALHLWLQRVRGREEEGRYVALRAGWGAAADRNFWIFFQAQGLLDALLSIPMLLAMRSPRGALDLADGAALLLWIVAVGGEALADRQLARFKARPGSRGTTCREGLWRFSRHPNYFFEWLHWFVYVAASAFDPWTLAGPAVMLFLMLRVTGIPPTEAQALRSRPDYADYQRTTSAFFPWFPKRP
jgi:steroid 5-alpha reductase family enzyme